MPITIYVVGSWTRPEFAEARDWLQSHTKAVRFSNLATVRQAIQSGEQDPDRLLLIQSRPGQFSPKEVAELRSVAPLTTISQLTGSWCEGETRSGFPLDNVPRYTWLTLKSQMMDVSRSHRETSSLLPFTTPDQDRWRAELSRCKPSTSRRIAVYSADPAQAAALFDALAEQGHDPVSQLFGTIDSPCELLIWDDAGGRRTSRMKPTEALEQLDLPSTTPRIALRTFPRIQTIESDRRDGFAATLAKPFQISDLLAQIEFCLADHIRNTFAA